MSERKPNKRNGMPSKSEIANFWTNTTEGMERIKHIVKEYQIDSEIFYSIELEGAHCWACQKNFINSKGKLKSYNHKDLGLQRCHIIPLDSGGSNKASNLFLLCGDCHKESPDTLDEYYFFQWLDNKESHYVTYQKKSTATTKRTLKRFDLSLEQFNFICDELGQEEVNNFIKLAFDELNPTAVGGYFAEYSRLAIVSKTVELIVSRHKSNEQIIFKLEGY